MKHFIIVFIAVLTNATAFAQDSLNVTRLWQECAWPPPYSMAIQGDYAYVSLAHGGHNGNWCGMSILNIANPAAPVKMGFCEWCDYGNVAVSGSHVYLATYDNLRIFDVSNPAAPPAEVGTCGLPANPNDRLSLSGNYAYVAALGSGLRIIDVSDPTAPFEAGIYYTPGRTNAVTVSGNYAYVAAGDSGLRIIDVSTSNAPEEVGFSPIVGSALDVCVSGSYAYVAAGDSGLSVIDVSNPADPFETGHGGARVERVAAAGGYAYLAADTILTVIDITNPAIPVPVGQSFQPCPGWCPLSDMDLLGDYTYVVRSGTIEMFDVSNPAVPTLARTFDGDLCVTDVVIGGGYAYLADRQRLKIMDISNPAAPMEVGSCMTGDEGQGVDVSGNYAYVAVLYDGLRVIDISNPAVPTEVGHWDSLNYMWDVAVSGSYAYVAVEGSGLTIIDIGDPTAPIEVGHIGVGYDDAYEVAVSGNYAYVADGQSGGSFGHGFNIFDISNPAEPTLTGFCNFPTFSGADGVAVNGDNAYVTCQAAPAYDSLSGLHVIDVSVPATPVQVAFFHISGVPQGVAISGNYAYVTTVGNGLRIIDISNPTAPVEVGYHDTPGDGLDVAVDGPLAYVADGSCFGIYDCSEAIGVGARSRQGVVPTQFALHQNYPNPFNPTATIAFDLPRANHISLRVFDVLGREVAVLKDGMVEAGRHRVVFDGSNLASGIYFARLEAGEIAQTKKLMLLK